MINKKEMTCYETDSSRLVGKVDKVVFPKNKEEVQKIVRSSNRDIVPRGAGTGLVGGTIPNNSLIVDLGKMNKISNFNGSRKTVYVGAGVNLKELNEKLKRVGFEFPLELSNQGIATIGGMIATNAVGSRSMKYGAMKDWVDQIEFVNGRGELMKTSKADLMDICGMEGITGIIVGATIRIIPKIKRSASIFQSDNFEEILSVVRRLKLEKEVVMLEFYPPYVSRLVGLPEKYHVLIEFDSDRGKIKDEEYESISKIKNKVYYFLASQGYYSSEDPKLFFDKLGEFVEFLEFNKIPYFGYLGSGIIHPFFKDDEQSKREETVKLIRKLGGKPGKYGIGLTRKYFIEPSEAKIMQRVKLRHDPFEKFNKGKVLDVDSNAKRSERAIRNYEELIKREKERSAEHLKGINKSEIDEIKEVFESKPSNTKTPEDKMEEFIEEIEFIDKLKSDEPIVKENKYSNLDYETKELLKDYKETYESELVEDKRLEVEKFAKNISKSIANRPTPVVETQIQRPERPKVDYNLINSIMTNKNKDVSNSQINSNSSNRTTISDNFERKGKVSESEQDMINKIMGNRFGIKSKEEKKDDEKRLNY